MPEPAAFPAAAIVAMPTEIDYGRAARAYDQLYAAFAADAPVVIADFTVTTVCDCAALRRLLAVQRRAAGRHAQLRVVAPPSGPVLRVLEITGLAKLLKVYPTAYHAAAAPWMPPSLPPATARPGTTSLLPASRYPSSTVRSPRPGAPVR